MRLAQQSQRGSLYPLTLLTTGRKMSVTISMDEVSFPAEEYGKVAVGQALLLRGQVNNAFNTSMEVGVLVTSEAPLPSHFSRHPKRIAHPHLMRCIQALGTGATATVCSPSSSSWRLTSRAARRASSPAPVQGDPSS